MDGIDGIAASQAVLAGAAWLVFGGLFGIDTIYYFAGVIAFSSLGFLVHNWSPAKIFMGDVGSVFSGLYVCRDAIVGGKDRKSGICVYIYCSDHLPMAFHFRHDPDTDQAPFARKRVWLAHREHLYQRLIIAGMTHRSVTLIYTLMTAAIIGSLFLSERFRGTWELFLLFTIVSVSAGLATFAHGKKGLT